MVNDFLGDKEFIRLLATRAGFSVPDTKILWKAVKEIVLETIAEKRPIYFHGFLDIRYTKFKRKNQWDGIRKQYTEPKEVSMINIKFGRAISKKLREEN